MHPALEALSAKQARALFSDQGAMSLWMSEHGVSYREAYGVIADLALTTGDEQPRPRPQRHDSEALREFVKRAVRLAPRMRTVAQLCLDEGLTLDETAARMGIARETVRVHLRRLRALKRRSDARRSARGDRDDREAEQREGWQ